MTEAADEIDRLRRDCAEAYQVVGALTSTAPDDPAVTKALDNLAAAAEGRPRPHDDLLPFTPAADPRDARTLERVAAWLEEKAAGRKVLAAQAQYTASRDRAYEAAYVLSDAAAAIRRGEPMGGTGGG